jgi:hypothetical protein
VVSFIADAAKISHQLEMEATTLQKLGQASNSESCLLRLLLCVTCSEGLNHAIGTIPGVTLVMVTMMYQRKPIENVTDATYLGI